MNIRFSTLILGAWLSLSSFNLNAQGFGFLIDSITVQPGQDFCVSVKTKNYIEILTFQGFIFWDAQVITFKKVENFNLPNMYAIDFVFTPQNPNRLIFRWDDPTLMCASRDSGEALFDLCFSAIGANDTNTFIRSDSGLAGICFSPFGIVPMDKDTGLVIISNPSSISNALQNEAFSFNLSPNPTASSAQVIFQSQSSGNAILLLTDALGRIVFEQKVTVNIGENRFEIPASALKIRGMYQVSLQTEKGISGQKLSVFD